MISPTNQPEKYATFWATFGRVLKEGVVEDAANRDRIATLLRFASTRAENDDQTVSLADYVGRMKDGQEAIYYITADGFARGPQQPAPRDLPQARRRGAADVRPHRRVGRIDAHRIRRQAAALGRQGRSRSRQAAAARRRTPAATTDAADESLLERIQAALQDRASAVRTTERLTDSPACLVSDEHGLSMNLERILKAAGQNVPGSRSRSSRSIPSHPIVKRLKSETDDARFADWSHILFDQATLAEGGQLEDPAGFVKRLNELMLTLAGEGPSRIWTPGM